MAPSFDPPTDFNSAIGPLGPTDRPFGENCLLEPLIQDVFYHYRFTPEMVRIIVAQGLTTLTLIREANPDGTEAQRNLFEDAVKTKIDGAVQQHLARLAFSRLCSNDTRAALKSKGDQGWAWGQVAKLGGKMAVGAAAGVVVPPLVLSAAGFGAAGVVGGSLAASVQSVFYGGTTSGVFSFLQSIGVVGLGAVGNSVAASVGAAAGAGAATVAKKSS